MIFFFKADGTLMKSAPDTVYQGSAEAGKVYVVAPLNSGMLVDVYYELPNGERWGAYLLENNGTVINDTELPDGWALWSTTLESAITQYAGTLKAQFGFYQSGTADKVPLITSQGVTITIAKGVVRDLPAEPTADVYAQIVNAISSIKQDIANLPNEFLSNTNEDKIALKNNESLDYSVGPAPDSVVKRDSDGKLNIYDGTEDLNAVNVRQLQEGLAGKIDTGSANTSAVANTIAQRTSTGTLKAADGVANDDLATVKQLNDAQFAGVSPITDIDLNTGDTTVEYDTDLGITVNAKGTITRENGNTEQPTTKFELPIVAGDGISIDKKDGEEKIEIKAETQGGVIVDITGSQTVSPEKLAILNSNKSANILLNDTLYLYTNTVTSNGTKYLYYSSALGNANLPTQKNALNAISINSTTGDYMGNSNYLAYAYGDNTQYFAAKTADGSAPAGDSTVVNVKYGKNNYMALDNIGMAAIPANADINNYTATGNYWASGVNGIKNLPNDVDSSKTVLKLFVGVLNGNSVYNILYAYSTDDGKLKGQFVRTNVEGIWTIWKKYATETDLESKQDKLVKGTNLLSSGSITIDISDDKITIGNEVLIDNSLLG